MAMMERAVPIRLGFGYHCHRVPSAQGLQKVSVDKGYHMGECSCKPHGGNYYFQRSNMFPMLIAGTFCTDFYTPYAKKVS